jgi:hypothetical protein
VVKQAPWVVEVVLENKQTISKGMDPYFNVLKRSHTVQTSTKGGCNYFMKHNDLWKVVDHHY